MKLTDVIRRPLVTEKTTILREDGRTLVLQVATAREQDSDPARRRDAVRQQGGRRAHDDHARQDQAAGPVRRPPPGLEEGVRPAARGREVARVHRGGLSASMPIRTYKPTSPGRRFQTVQVFDDITATRPHKPLTEPLKKSGGRNNRGELSSWWRGGGHKRVYRVIDFKRDKIDIPGKVVDDRVRPEPLGAHRAGHLRGRREALHPAAAGAEGGRHDRRRASTSTSCRATRCRSRTSRWAR